MNWFQKNKKKIIAGVVILAVLAFAFWYGGDAPGLRGWSVNTSETNQEQAGNEQSNTAETQGPSENDHEDSDKTGDEKQDEGSKTEDSGEKSPEKTESVDQKTDEKDKPGNDQNPGVKPEDKQDTKPEVKPEEKPDTKPEDKPEVKPGDKPDPAPGEDPKPAETENADKEAAKAVEDLINGIGKVSLGSKDAIDKAQAAYGKLTDAQKALVGNKAKLDEAVAEYARLAAEEEKQKGDSEDKKPEDKPDPKPEDNQDPKPEDKPDPKPEDNQNPKPEDKPDTKPEENQDPKPEDKPEENPDPKPEDKPNPAPEDDPAPVEPEKKELHCKFSISCETILKNRKYCDPDKWDYVPKDGWIYKTHTVTFTEGESVYDVLKRICKENKIQLEASFTPMYNSVYVEGIHNLYEFDVGNLSGWMYKVNGWFPNYGASRYILKDGDECHWVYTCDLGYDVGGGYAAGGK